METIILNELKESTGFYKIDRANNNKLSFNRTTRKISNLYDQSLSQNDATQSNNNIKPKLCKKKNRVNNRYFVEFNGRVFISDIDLSPSSGTPNITNFFVVYRLRGYDASINWLRNCFFVQNDRFVGFSTIGDLVISNSTNTFMRIGAANDAVAPFKNKANAGLLNKWYSLSVHWYDDGSSRTNKSSVYCNRVKLTNFTSTGLQLNKKMVIGALSYDDTTKFSNFGMNLAGTGFFKGDIALIVFRKGIMEENPILMYHELFCEKWYNINHNPIE